MQMSAELFILNGNLLKNAYPAEHACTTIPRFIHSKYCYYETKAVKVEFRKSLGLMEFSLLLILLITRMCTRYFSYYSEVSLFTLSFKVEPFSGMMFKIIINVSLLLIK